jgi:hypothetical protein
MPGFTPVQRRNFRRERIHRLRLIAFEEKKQRQEHVRLRSRKNKSEVELRYLDALKWIRLNARRRRPIKMNEEERLTAMVRSTPGWPGPDSQPMSSLEVLRAGPMPVRYPRSAMKKVRW